uniref:Ankyrin repeat domain 39 n=1 Tax=Astyanax mexicanus TaxID=7994 RepID=A0A3B1JQU7_ASTMX
VYFHKRTVIKLCLSVSSFCTFLGCFCSAALDGDLERVRSFLAKTSDPNIRDQSGYTALVTLCSRAGHQSVCELLLDQGARANSQTRGGATALHRAAYCGHLAIIQLLLTHRADPSLTDDDGSTSLHKAAEQGHVDVCELLVMNCPALRSMKDKRSRLPSDLCLKNSALLDRWCS